MGSWLKILFCSTLFLHLGLSQTLVGKKTENSQKVFGETKNQVKQGTTLIRKDFPKFQFKKNIGVRVHTQKLELGTLTKTEIIPEFFYCGPQMAKIKRFLPKQPNPNGRERLVMTNYGFNMFVDRTDGFVSANIQNFGTWEPKYINLIGHILKKGDKVLNLGSQSGLQALIMGKIVGPTGKLFIFEPYSFSYSLVKKNIELNNLNDITTIYQFGASDEKSVGTLQINHQNTGASSITQSQSKGNVKNNQQQEVKLERVDTLLPTDVSLDFALIDVEKMEIKALKGMKGVIERSPNLIIMSEWLYLQNNNRNQAETLQLLNFMTKKGYRLYRYSGGNHNTCEVGKFKEIPKVEDLLKIPQTDIFFFPKDSKLPS